MPEAECRPFFLLPGRQHGSAKGLRSSFPHWNGCLASQKKRELHYIGGPQNFSLLLALISLFAAQSMLLPARPAHRAAARLNRALHHERREDQICCPAPSGPLLAAPETLAGPSYSQAPVQAMQCSGLLQLGRSRHPVRNAHENTAPSGRGSSVWSGRPYPQPTEWRGKYRPQAVRNQNKDPDKSLHLCPTVPHTVPSLLYRRCSIRISGTQEYQPVPAQLRFAGGAREGLRGTQWIPHSPENGAGNHTC